MLLFLVCVDIMTNLREQKLHHKKSTKTNPARLALMLFYLC